MGKDKIIGIDVGGTSIKIGFIHSEGKIEHKWEIPTNLTEQGKFIVREIWVSIKEKFIEFQNERAQFMGIGIGAPGFIDTTTGVVHKAVNIGWENFELAKDLADVSGLPVHIGNDANVAALGEYWQGAGQGAKDLIAITLGTGVGGGIITNGEMISGANGTAGEIGHMTVDPQGYRCNCGRKGCLETLVSATGIVRQAIAKLKSNPTSDLAKFYEENNGITAKDVFTLAKQGDPQSKQLIHQIGDLLGFTIANLAMVINPAKILIGGGVSKAGEQLLYAIRTSFKKYALPRVNDACEIKIAQLGNDAGMIGAAYLAKQKNG